MVIALQDFPDKADMDSKRRRKRVQDGEDVQVMSQQHYTVQVLGGHKLTQAKPLFSNDGRSLMVPSGSSVRLYSTKTKSFQREISCQDSTVIDNSDEVFYAQLHPADPDNLLVFFTRKGKMVVSDMTNNKDVLVKDLLRVASLDSNKISLTFANVVSVMSKSGKTKRVLNIYFGVSKDSRVYHYPIDDVFQEKASVKKSQQRLNMIHKLTLIRPQDHKNGIEEDKSKMAFSPMGKFIVCAYIDELSVHPIFPDQRRTRLHKMAQNPGRDNNKKLKMFTCIACHPREECVATGVSDGVILIWSDIVNDTKCPKRQLHWHPNAVSDLCFSAAGTHLYSIGQEPVLVSWDVKTGQKSFRPRLGVPIKMVTIDPTNSLLVLQFHDNRLRVMSTELNDHQEKEFDLNEMTFDIFSSEVKQCFYEPNSQSLVMLGQPGQLQFYNVKTGKKKDMEVIPRTYVFNEVDGRKLVQMTITAFAVSSDGTWIATDELRDDGVTFVEERLKFWSRDQHRKTYEVNTVIHLPHDKSVTSLRFSQDAKTAISLSNDCTFKIWQQRPSGSGKSMWSLNKTCFKNNSWIPSDVKMSFDSSLAAVIFESSFITFWSTSTGVLVPSDFCNTNGASAFPVIGVSFATGVHSHYFVEVRSNRLRVWNFLKKCLTWSYTSSLMSNKQSATDAFVNMGYDEVNNRIAVYCKDFSVVMFDLLKSEPFCVINDEGLNQQSMTCCLFVPSTAVKPKTKDKIDPSLLFFNHRRELIGLLPVDFRSRVTSTKIPQEMETEEPVKGGVNILGQTVFVDAVVPAEEELKQEGQRHVMAARNVIEAEFDVSRVANVLMVQPPSHILPSIHQLAKTFMTSLFLKQDPPSLQRPRLKRPQSNVTNIMDDDNDTD